MLFSAFRFFKSRNRLDKPSLERERPPITVISPTNVSPRIYAVLTSKYATLVELQNSLSIEDLVDLLEVISVESNNELAWSRHFETKRGLSR